MGITSIETETLSGKVEKWGETLRSMGCTNTEVMLKIFSGEPQELAPDFKVELDESEKEKRLTLLGNFIDRPNRDTFEIFNKNVDEWIAKDNPPRGSFKSEIRPDMPAKERSLYGAAYTELFTWLTDIS